MEYKETKANKAISFWHFIQEHTVEIPISYSAIMPKDDSAKNICVKHFLKASSRHWMREGKP